MTHVYNSSEVYPPRQFRQWCDVICDTFFPMSLKAHQKGPFSGKIDEHRLGSLTLADVESDSVSYRREKNHIARNQEEYFLISLPRSGKFCFTQNGKSINCHQGECTVEYSGEPYTLDLENNHHTQIRALKVPAATLRNAISTPESYIATSFNLQSGTGALFYQFLSSVNRELGHLQDKEALVISKNITELLAIMLDSKVDSLPMGSSAARAAHLHRIKRFINLNLPDDQLSPQKVAECCGVSLSYLHQLFKDTGWTVMQWIKERRLEECFSALSNPKTVSQSIAEIAYRSGFSDPTHFGRSFKSRYMMSPREVRAAAVNGADLSTAANKGFVASSF